MPNCATRSPARWPPEEPVEIVGGGSKRALGRPLQTPHLLDLSRLSGIRDYAPSELVLTAGAATPLAEIERALAECRPDAGFRAAGLARSARAATANRPANRPWAARSPATCRGRGGSRRGRRATIFSGFAAVSGRGEIFKAGGKVVKNVTGYDLCKLMAGSYGTLAALEEVTVKVLPRPETVATVLFSGVAPGPAVRLMGAALGSPHEVSGAAYLPSGTAGLREGRVALRVEGPAPSVMARRDSLLAEHRGAGTAELLGDAESAALWRAIGEVAPLLEPGERAVWRISVAPARGAELAEALARALEAKWLLDWGGGLVWAAVPECRAMTPAPRRSGARSAEMTEAAPGTRRWSRARPRCAGPSPCSSRSPLRSPRCRAASRRRSTRRTSSIRAAWSRSKPGER